MVGEGRSLSVLRVGFRRRVAYACERTDDLRVTCALCLVLARPVATGERVRVVSPIAAVEAVASPFRYSPAVHCSHEGYLTHGPKVGLVGATLGTLGELDVGPQRFTLVDERGHGVFRGVLRPRADRGFTCEPPPYTKVWAADFTEVSTPGRYRLVVEGLGASHPFFIDDAVGADLARAYALGLYHQRCGVGLSLPYTRFAHAPCHVAPAEVPTVRSRHTQDVLLELSRQRDGRQSAPALSSVARARFPFSKAGRVDVHGGHHDAGDYSKYLIDSALLVHALTFTADCVPGASRIDNLGLPESGDGVADLLQMACHEADFICRAQDGDGGFYFLVYPRDRKYEWDVPPDRGDRQVVFPKNTSATAACVAALAQISASPSLRASRPREAARYLRAARAGFAFLERAWTLHGRVGAYQRITHYGAEFADRDEIAWAEAEMAVATGEPRYARLLAVDFDPRDPETLRWTWWRMYEGYGCATRTIAFRGRAAGLPADLVEACRQRVLDAGRDQVLWADACAYRTSFPLPDKRFGNAVWHAGGDHAFDAMAAALIAPSASLFATVVSNLDFDQGANPSNVDFVTGLGWRRPREIVSQAHANDWRKLPPSGLAVGSLRSVEPFLPRFGTRLRELSFPPDDAPRAPSPLYDRWSDSWHVQTELVTATQARCLGAAIFLMVGTPQARQPWRGAAAEIRVPPARAGEPLTVRLTCGALDLSKASRIVWERAGCEPVFGGVTLTFTPLPGVSKVEAEAQMPDGRRISAAASFSAR